MFMIILKQMTHNSSLHHSALAFLLLTVSTMASCKHDSLEDRADKDVRAFTERYCPTPMKDNQRTDSVTFDKATRTFSYYFDLGGPAENKEVIDTMRTMLRKALVEDLKKDVGARVYKDAGYNYHYVFYAASDHKVLFEETLTEKDYK